MCLRHHGVPHTGRNSQRALPIRDSFRILPALSLCLSIALPKCPFCIAALLATLGIGVSARKYLAMALSPTLRPWIVASFAVVLLIQVFRLLPRARSG